MKTIAMRHPWHTFHAGSVDLARTIGGMDATWVIQKIERENKNIVHFTFAKMDVDMEQAKVFTEQVIQHANI